MSQAARHMKRAHQLNLLMIYIIVVMVVLPFIFEFGLMPTLQYSIAGTTIIVLATINYRIRYADHMKALLFPALPLVVIIALFYLDGFAINKHYFLVITLMMAAVYFNRRILWQYSILLLIGLLVIYIGAPAGFLGENNRLTVFVTVFVVYMGMIASLYFITISASKFIEEAEAKHKQSEALLQQLEETLQAVKHGASTVQQEATEVEQHMQTMQLSSEEVLNSTTAIAAQIEREATTIAQVYAKVHDSSAQINDSIEATTEVAAQAMKMVDVMQETSERTTTVTTYMETVQQTVTATTQTVDGLMQRLAEVNELLGGIRTVADQTNLLALNAAIESARAGDAGKGFAVVADEVRKLAEQSAQLTQHIHDVTTRVMTEATSAQQQAHAGHEAVEKGSALLRNIAQQLEMTAESATETSAQLTNNTRQLEGVATVFTYSKEQLQQLVQLSEENTQITEEIVQALAQEASWIGQVVQATGELRNLSDELHQLSNTKS